MQKKSKIFGLLADDKKLDTLVKNNNFKAINDYLKKLRKVSEVKASIITSAKRVDDDFDTDEESKDFIEKNAKKGENEVEADTTIRNYNIEFDKKDFYWVRYNGIKSKSIIYQGYIIKILPKEIIGICKNNKTDLIKLVLPIDKKVIFIKKDIFKALENKIKKYKGNIDLVL